MKLPINYNLCHWTTIKRAREEYVKIQNGKCYYCGNLLCDQPEKSVLNKCINKELFPENFFKWPTHLHHCHKTGMTIGAVHSYCNAVLWQYHGE